jgi:hypothetical protein
MMRKLAKIRIHNNIILKSIGLPETTKIINLKLCDNPDFIDIVIEHEDLPIINTETQPIPFITPSTQIIFKWGI